MALFESYEREFSALMADITRKIGVIPDLEGDEKKRDVQSANRDVDEAHELLEQMELDVMDLPSANRGKAKKKIGSFKSTLQQSEKELRRAAVAMSSTARDELFAYDTNEDARAALLSNTDRLDRTSMMIEDGQRMAMETTDVAAGIMQDLHEQRETIERSRGRLRGVDSNLTKSARVLNGMITRAKQNRVVTFAIIVIACGLIGLISYLIVTG